MNIEKMILTELKEWIRHDENQAGDKLEMIDASDLPEIVRGIVKRINAGDIIESLPVKGKDITINDMDKIAYRIAREEGW